VHSHRRNLPIHFRQLETIKIAVKKSARKGRSHFSFALFISAPKGAAPMPTTLQDNFLRQASAAARAAGHIFPDYAACEAALESTWGQSRLAREANNLFGQKQSAEPHPDTASIAMPTQEFLHGQWITVTAHWVRFADQAACFRARMALLRCLEHSYPAYARALAAATGEVFIEEVSRAWSTDPRRAAKVLAIHRQHSASFLPLPPPVLIAGRPAAHVAHG
jgi:flagellum-specific peptidoglycan hydrolase FlgJ